MNEKKQHNEKYLYDENVETAEKVNAKDYVMSSQNTYTQTEAHGHKKHIPVQHMKALTEKE